MMDLTAHFLAMMVMVSGSGNIGSGRSSHYNFHLKDILEVAKSLVFLIITFKLAFGKDKSDVAYDEWFPPRSTIIGHHCQHDPRSWAVVGDDNSEEEERAKTREDREKKTR